MLKLRLSMGGTKKRPVYKIVVADSRFARDGRFIEKLGFFNPLLPKDKKERVGLESDRIKYCQYCNVEKTLESETSSYICTNCGLIFNKYFKLSTNKNHTCDPKFLKKRSDDNEETIMNRFETYLNKTLPILDFYKKHKISKIRF